MAIIDGRLLAAQIKDEIAAEIFSWKGPRPNLAIVLASDREDSKLYVSLKEKEAKSVGIDTNLYLLNPELASEEEFLEVIKFLNNDETVDGILVQLPLPEKYNTDKIISALDPQKDVDGFHPKHPDYILSPVFASVLQIVNDLKYELSGKNVLIVHNSDVFGLSLKDILEARGAQVNLAHADDSDLTDKAIRADVLISAIGRPKFITGDMIKKDALVIDVGISKIDGKVYGDVDFEEAKDRAAFITPVPGGIGPMTIAMLFRNTLTIYKKRRGQ